MPIVNNTSVGNAGLDFTSKPQTTTASGQGALDKNAFLKLLAAQAKYQDPLNPSDSSQQMAQLAQFSSLEQMSNVATAVGQLQVSAFTDRAVSLVGHDVTYTDANGAAATGTVEAVTLTADGPQLRIGGVSGIPANSVTEVR
jgi:flagellar basal-body rod modification protein FlgD